MFVERFMAWSVAVGAEQRAKAIVELAHSYLNNAIAEQDRASTEQVFSHYLKDPSTKVRAAMAVALCEREGAPRRLLRLLSIDICEVASKVFERSQMFHPSELAHALSNRSQTIQIAIARRGHMTADLARLVVEKGCAQAVEALLINEVVSLSPALKHDIATRMGADCSIRNLLLEDDAIWPSTRQLLARKVADHLASWASDFAFETQFDMSEPASDATNLATVEIAERTDPAEMNAYVSHLHETEQLTPALLVRAICSGHAALFENAIALLSGASLKRVQAIVDEGRLSAFRALYRKTGLPLSARAVFEQAIAAWQHSDQPSAVVDMILGAIGDADEVDGDLMALLARIDGEHHQTVRHSYDDQLLLAA